MIRIEGTFQGMAGLVEAALPIGPAQARQFPGIIIVDENDHLVLANERVWALLPGIRRTVNQPDGRLPDSIAALVSDLRSRLNGRTDTSAIALISVDVCVRACMLDGPPGQHVVLLLERLQRRDTVEANLAKYALTPRERDVALLVLYGCPNRRIAERLCLTRYTVEDHLKRIYAKTRVAGRTALVAKMLGWRNPDGMPG